eukprot:GHVL01041794.1.p1 GENE.GHVL01041794.1~~GHVL01041794.1.p1  ORF type:complete len:166 (+),score=47.94 GHVL01041794.1:145-642(+)
MVEYFTKNKFKNKNNPPPFCQFVGFNVTDILYNNQDHQLKRLTNDPFLIWIIHKNFRRKQCVTEIMDKISNDKISNQHINGSQEYINKKISTIKILSSVVICRFMAALYFSIASNNGYSFFEKYPNYATVLNGYKNNLKDINNRLSDVADISINEINKIKNKNEF